MKHKVLLTFFLFLGLLFSSCGYVKIARIQSDPSHFQSRTIAVNGTVTNYFGNSKSGLYELSDGSGKIYVEPKGQAPSKGAKVRVTGRVVKGVKVMGRSFGAVIRERDRKLRQ